MKMLAMALLDVLLQCVQTAAWCLVGELWEVTG